MTIKEITRFKYLNETEVSHEMKLSYNDNGTFDVTIDGKPAIFGGDANSMAAFFELSSRIPEMKTAMSKVIKSVKSESVTNSDKPSVLKDEN